MKLIPAVVEYISAINPRTRMFIAMSPLILFASVATAAVETKIDTCGQGATESARVISFLAGNCDKAGSALTLVK